MNADRWDRLQTLFHAAADLTPASRRAFLQRACGEDSDLLTAVLALLDEDARGGSPLDRTRAGLARQVLLAAGTDIPAASRIGPYTLTSCLGEGGMGVVYLAQRADLDTHVAIKILRDGWVSPSRRERFASEQRTLARLNHQSIARIYDADTLPDGTPWFAMEYVDGLPITEYCTQEAVPLPTRLQLFRQVCEAVQYAHRHLIVHRDIKPSNVLVSHEQQVKLLDFGIARQLESQDAALDRTRTVLPLMTPAYAAPEQIRGEPTGIHTDVYALGVLLYELLTGRRPFDLSDRTPGEAEAIITRQQPEKPSTACRRPGGGVSASRSSWRDLDVLCLTAMRKDPQRRYATVDALVRDLHHYTRREPLEARRESLSSRADKFIRRNWRLLSSAASVAALLAGVIAFSTVHLERARREAVAEAARTQRIQQYMLSLFTAGEQHDAPAADLRVLTLLERGVRDAGRLDSDPVVQAELYHTLGTIHRQLGIHDQADALLRTALERRQALHGHRHADVVDSLVALGLLRVEQAQLDQAEVLLREAYRTAHDVLSADHPLRARATAALGKALRERGAYDEAIPLLDEAVGLYSASPTATEDLSAALTALANTHFYAGRTDRAERLYRRTLVISRELHGDRHPSVAHDLLNLGATSSSRGNHAEAERRTREALEILEGWYGRAHPETASALVILGQALRFQDRHDEAAPLLREALVTQERVYGASHPRVAFALNELGGVAQQQQDLDEAEAAYRRALDIYTAVYEGRHPRVGIAMANLAGVYQARSDYTRAEELFRAAMALYAELLPDNHVNLAIARIRLGRTLLAQQRPAEAEVHLRRGYDVVTQRSPDSAWLRIATEGLANAYETLGQPDKAELFRMTLADAGT